MVILDEIEPTKTHGLFLPTFIDRMIYDTCHTSHNGVATIGKPHLQVSMVKGRILLGEQTQFIAHQHRDIRRDILEELIGELDKPAELASTSNFFYNNIFHNEI